MRASLPRLAAFTLATCLLSGLPAHGQMTPLFVIPIESESSEPVPPGDPLRVALYSQQLPALAGVLGMPAPAPGAERLVYVVGTYPQLAAAADRSWLESTFVIDFEEADAVRVHGELVAARGTRPTRPQIVEFVASALTPSSARGWDLASTVARRREGDCTEFAVLTAALARASRIPARVVVGVALVSRDGGYHAYGHAWAELLENGRWMVADAALLGEEGVRYLPNGVFTDEGPGYNLHLARLTIGGVQRVVVLGPQPRTR